AARAEAAILVIDAKEGIRENSKRHGYMMSFLGIKNVTVCINKMDLVNYSQTVFEKIKTEYLEFLEEINLTPRNFIPISAFNGDNLVSLSTKMPWYKGMPVLDSLDDFKKAAPRHAQDFRFPVQDIYKFTEEGDERRIFAGRVEAGTIKVGDEVVFLPSQKTSRVSSIEGFNVDPQKEAFAGQSTGVCLDTQVYIRPGEILCKASERRPHVSRKFKANIFWMGKQPLVKNKTYKLKVTTQQVPVILAEIVNVLDASELSSISNKQQVDRHDVGECIFETLKPIAFDEIHSLAETGRFVIVDDYEISGGGIILAPVFDEQSSINERVRKREFNWQRSSITLDKRAQKYDHKSAFIIITGQVDTGKQKIARALEEELFKQGKNTYFLGVSNELMVQEAVAGDKVLAKHQHLQQLGELARIITDAGLIFITSITDIDDYELEMLKSLNRPNKTLVINVGENSFTAGKVDLILPISEEIAAAISKIVQLLVQSVVLDPEYTI
ncbi:MAG: adenylyl-sulfate kinase, partial [Omnitrophica WOR_2 bacterium GWA2_47_8]